MKMKLLIILVQRILTAPEQVSQEKQVPLPEETQCLSKDPTAPKKSIQGFPGALEEILDLGKNRGA